MKNFINAGEFSERRPRASKERMERFIDEMNKALKRGERYISTAEPRVPFLNETEFSQVQKRAAKQGWYLTEAEDNYQTTMYKMEKKLPDCIL